MHSNGTASGKPRFKCTFVSANKKRCDKSWGVEGLISLLQSGADHLSALRATGESSKKQRQSKKVETDIAASPIVKAMQKKLDNAILELSRLRHENATLREALKKDGKLPQYVQVAEKSLPETGGKTAEMQLNTVAKESAPEQEVSAKAEAPVAAATIMVAAQNKALAELKFVPKA